MTEKDHMDAPEGPKPGPRDLPPPRAGGAVESAGAGGAAESPTGAGIASEPLAAGVQRMHRPGMGVGGGDSGGLGPDGGAKFADQMRIEGLSDEEKAVDRMQAEKTAAALILQNPGSNDAQIAHAISVMGAPRDQARAMLKNLGHDDTRIEDIMSNYGIGMPEALTEEEKGQVDSKEETEEIVRNFEEDPISEKLRALEKKANDPNSKPTDADLADIERARGKIRHFFFDEADGVFRREERVRRLLIKPGVSSLFALGITYLCLLSFATKWATKRVGSG